jgi:hypothetical protein
VTNRVHPAVREGVKKVAKAVGSGTVSRVKTAMAA